MIERSSNVPRIIDRLVAKKLVERTTSEFDKRETVMNPTTDGLDLLENATLKVERLFASTVGIDEKDARQLNLLLENMRTSE